MVNLFTVFLNVWDSMTDATTSMDSLAPIVNVDGTLMLDDNIDIHGNPFGMTTTDSSFDAGMSFDNGSSWSVDDSNSCF